MWPLCAPPSSLFWSAEGRASSCCPAVFSLQAVAVWLQDTFKAPLSSGAGSSSVVLLFCRQDTIRLPSVCVSLEIVEIVALKVITMRDELANREGCCLLVVVALWHDCPSLTWRGGEALSRSTVRHWDYRLGQPAVLLASCPRELSDYSCRAASELRSQCLFD